MSPQNVSQRHLETDCVVVGASFAGLACATVLGRAGLRTTVLERKSDAGQNVHTTGIIVKDAFDQVALLDALPASLCRRIDGVRLYAPNLQFVDLFAPDYYFVATDTPEVMRWLAGQAESAGVEIAYDTPFVSASRHKSGFELPDGRSTRYLVGADGPGSKVARAFGLGLNQHFLSGIEHEFNGVSVEPGDRLHCFIDRHLAPGYIAWVVPGVHGIQVGLARRPGRVRENSTKPIVEFIERIRELLSLPRREPDSVRAGLIPCGGTVHPVAGSRVLLVGDAAGIVSPLTAGGIHTALKHGLAAGHAVEGFLSGAREDPGGWFADAYPRFRVKRVLRFLFDHFQSDTLFNLLLGTRAMRMAASQVYFHHRGAFDAVGGAESDPDAERWTEKSSP